MKLLLGSRFFSANGNFVGWRRLPFAFVSFRQALQRRLWGQYPRLPWIPFSAIHAIETVLKPNWIVWEIGSGYSTLWLADRVRSIVSLEYSREWFELLSATIAAEKLENVDLRHVECMERFEGLVDGALDFLFIDSGHRTQCLEKGFCKVKPGGYLYLDNWDNKLFWEGATAYLESVKEQIAGISTFIDYVPALVSVNEGLLIQKRIEPKSA